jgi:hypothetical protein
MTETVQRPEDVPVLPGEVLMDEEDLHAEKTTGRHKNVPLQKEEEHSPKWVVKEWIRH